MDKRNIIKWFKARSEGKPIFDEYLMTDIEFK